MRIEKVTCRNFRNIENCSIELDKGINVITGKNGQGKTNFLESIYYLSTTRSFRINKDQELIMYQKPLAKIECTLHDDEIKKHLSCVIHDKGKTCFISNQQIPRTSEFAGTLNAILFSPSDLELFTASPKTRRRMMDVEIGKIDSQYSYQLNKYNKLMKERNASLKQNHMDFSFLDVIEKQMAECEVMIMGRRNDFVEFINHTLSKRYQQLSKENCEVSLCYCKALENLDETTLEQLIVKRRESRERDFILKITSFGIHRDDLNFLFNGKSLESIASQGQRRMVILSLKMAFVDYVMKKTSKKPVLLLDDVLSELDIEKRRNLFQTIPENIQTIITTTEVNDVLEELPTIPKIMVVEQGRFIE